MRCSLFVVRCLRLVVLFVVNRCLMFRVCASCAICCVLFGVSCLCVVCCCCLVCVVCCALCVVCCLLYDVVGLVLLYRV